MNMLDIVHWNIAFSDTYCHGFNSKCSDGELLYVVLHRVLLPGISMLPAMKINFSNEVESATMVAQESKSSYFYHRRGQPLMIWGWSNSRQKNLKTLLQEKINFEDPSAGNKKFWEASPRKKRNFERPCQGKKIIWKRFPGKIKFISKISSAPPQTINDCPLRGGNHSPCPVKKS